MAIDISQFQESFFEESFEGLDIMETGLLELNPGDPDIERVNQIFRAVHSIKGGAGTFGFSAIGSLTHVMETVLDEMRDGQRQVTAAAVEVLLQGVDRLRDILSASKAEEPLDDNRIAEIQKELDSLLDGDSAESESGGDGSSSNEGASETGVDGYDIKFQPHSHLLRTGNDPVRMLRELGDLGRLEVVADLEAMPGWDDLNPEDSHLSWCIQLESSATKDQIDEVFTWVDGDCDLEVSAKTKEVSGSSAVEGNAVVAAAQDNRSEKSIKRMESSSIRVGIEKVDELINMVGELVITQSMLGEIGENFDVSHLERLREGLSQLERNTRELQESVMRIRMVPVSFVFSRFPRVVHDVSRKLDKKVELQISGEQTEVDKTVLERISDPLTHLVRNSLDHGIECPEDRLAAGKPEVGTIHLNAYHHGGNIVIEISDDGAGLDREKILQKAVEKGIAKADENLTDDKIYELIFQPGFSTADQVSDVSGRGVGMDVVMRNIDSLSGSIAVESISGQGTTISIRLPLTLAILDGQTVSIGPEKYILPLISIVETIQIKEDEIAEIAGGGEIFRLRDEYLPVLRLSGCFGVESRCRSLAQGLIVVVEGGGQKIGVAVDDLQAQQQIVIKSLETNFRKVEGLSGATILGDGTVALILDVAGLIKMKSHDSSKLLTVSQQKNGDVLQEA